MKQERRQMVQRPFNFAIVDEVDSILIDEARTPLIISGPTEDKTDMYVALDAIINQLVAIRGRKRLRGLDEKARKSR